MLHCYYMNVNCDCSTEQSHAFYKKLPIERQERIKRMTNQQMAKKKILTGAFLQSVIRQETGIETERQQYSYNDAGRPFLANATGRIDFNLSDSGQYAVLAVSDERVGIDIEYKQRNYRMVAKRFFCKEEYDRILSFEEEKQQNRMFLRYWTMKEAYVKYEGSGLGVPLNSFRIVWDEPGEHCVVYAVSDNADTGNADKDIPLAHGSCVFLPGGYCVSVCQKNPVEKLHIMEQSVM